MDYLDLSGRPNSVDPPTKHLTFGPWIYMVPQYKPESVLMLGFAGGTTAGLIRLLYGDIPITAVDIVPCAPAYGVEFVCADAKEYVKTCGNFDCVIVDVFDNDGWRVCDFVSSEEFVLNLKRMANYIIVNTVGQPDLSAYGIFKKIGVNKPARLANLIYYFTNGELPNLFPI